MTGYQPQPYVPQAGTPPLEMPHYGISFGGAIARGFNKYSVFTGRASRSEFWWWYLFINLVGLVLAFVVGITATSISQEVDGTLGVLSLIFGVVSFILLLVFAVGTIVPSLALGVRRLHDAGYSGLFMLVGLIPYVGSMIILIFALLPSSPAGAKYDPITATPEPYSPYPPQNPYPS